VKVHVCYVVNNQDFYTTPAGTATVMARLMRHNFELEDDDENGPCECDHPSGKCIMETT